MLVEVVAVVRHRSKLERAFRKLKSRLAGPPHARVRLADREQAASGRRYSIDDDRWWRRGMAQGPSDADRVPAVELLSSKGRRIIHAGFPPRGMSLAKTCWASLDLAPYPTSLERQRCDAL